VIGHVVQNGLDATTKSGHVVIRVYPKEHEAVIEVEDDGVGMTEQFICNELFRPFQTTKPQGMGIGMYESRQYVQTLGGSIQVESTVAAGTTVRVLLPKRLPGVAATQGMQEVA
jgi:signal transduction histidine kinase